MAREATRACDLDQSSIEERNFDFTMLYLRDYTIIVLCRLAHLYKVFVLITIMAMVVQLKFSPQIQEILNSACPRQVDCWFSSSNKETLRTLCSPVQNNSSRWPSRIFAGRIASPFCPLLALFQKPANVAGILRWKSTLRPRACEMVCKVIEH